MDTAGCRKNSGGSVTTDKACGQRDGPYFLYKGGCYSTSDATGQKPCTAASAGVCSAAATGCFIPPGATKTNQAIMACDDTAEITLTNTKKYAGAATVGHVMRPMQQARPLLKPPHARREGTCPCRDPPDPAGPLLPRPGHAAAAVGRQPGCLAPARQPILYPYGTGSGQQGGPRHRPDSPALYHSRCTEGACIGFTRVAQHYREVNSEG